MSTVLLDEQLTGYVGYLRTLAGSDAWKGLSQLLGLQFSTFRDFALSTGTTDHDLWHFCQAQRIYLLTDNRNQKGADSLEETIRSHNSATSLPVFTVSSRDRLAQDRDYGERVLRSLLERLIDADNLLGTGRLYLP